MTLSILKYDYNIEVKYHLENGMCIDNEGEGQLAAVSGG